MKQTLLTLLAVVLAFVAQGSEITRNTTLTDGDVLYASDLHGLIDNATIGTGFYEDQTAVGVLQSGYYFLVLDATGSSPAYRRIDAQTVLYGNTNLFLNLTTRTPTNNAFLLFYDPTNHWLGRVNITNMFWTLSSNINVASIGYANTNNDGATNRYVLQPWPFPFTGTQTNNQPMSLWWDTNGVPYQQSLSNLESAEAPDLGTNLLLPYNFAQLWSPWTFYATNTFTNAWGYYSNFPIASLYLTNSANPTNDTPTLMDSDTVPIYSTQQSTNTTATLDALYAYMTNRNALPNYSQARIQFCGIPATLVITNINQGANAVTNAPYGFAEPQAVSFWLTNGPVQLASTPQIATNQIYFAMSPSVSGVSVTNSFCLYTNYINAYYQTNAIALGSPGASRPQMWWLTNFCSYNADVIQLQTNLTVRTGVFDVYFRTPSPTPYYYVTGMAMDNNLSGDGLLSICPDNAVTTNMVRLLTINSSSTHISSPRVMVQISPQ